ncbi:MAG: hypothetical protein LBI96_02505 [Odoribacteraceae bacterium]|jgi:hypothetical protein|nr:hypothetical protein [Odoribacteraceae bacterium]
MKTKETKRRNFLLLALVAASMAGCTFENGTEIETAEFTVYRRDWQWNSDYNRFECIMDYPELGTGIYRDGTVLGAVYILESDGNGEYEVLKTLPFTESLPYNNRSYTKTMSFDIAPRQITFYIQSSDLSSDEGDLGTYTFKITLIWERDSR